MKAKGVVAKLLFLISVYEFPYYCNIIYLIRLYPKWTIFVTK